ncbi:MAG: carboxypeptidase regulatory-like domain-containing protein [Acidobacteriota bacterium]|nr:carboxypeptidase regulatory-like domain-containing protein [Acidobacteriota bacterium]
MWFRRHGAVARRAAVAFCVAALLLAPKGNSQIAGTGNIQGTVSDPSGAVISNAQVTVTDVATGVKHQTVSSGGGLFSLPNLVVGTYNLSCSASGFKTYSRNEIVLEVGSNIGINVTMSVGAANEEVVVQANGVSLQTQDTSFKQTIDEKEVNELPLNGRQMTDLIVLSGGAANAPGNDMVGSKNFFSSKTISIAGGMGNQTDYRLDGADNNDYMTNVNLPFPFPDAVNQFSVESTAMGAQSGLHPGGEVNVVTNSGTNAFHGDAFEYIRNNYIDATNFFSSSPDQLHQHQFGGTLGGPIRSNKLFFFAGYQRVSHHEKISDKTAYVPSAANLAGDFSASDSTPLYNPLTGDLLVNNQIAPSYFSPVSLALEKYLPQTTDPAGKVKFALPGDYTENQFVTRIDANLSSKNNLYGRYLLDGYAHPAAFSPTDALVTTTAGNLERAQSLTVGDSYVFNPHMVNSVHLTADRRRDDREPAAQGVSPNGVGISMYNNDPNFFRFTTSSKFSLYCGTCAPSHFNVNTFAVSDDVNLVRGKHQIVFGGEFVRSQFNASNHYEMNGAFTFTGDFSQKGPGQNQKKLPAADANLDFLTGALHGFEQSKAQGNSLRAPIPTLYIQDTWQATPKLVLTAGVRWQPEFMPTDYFHRGAVFDEASFVNNVQSLVYPNAPAGVFYYGDKGVPKNYTQNSPWQFSPRLGVTWNPDGVGKTVFRVGGALIYDEPNFFTSNRNQQNPPFATAASTVPTTTPLDFADPWSSGSAPGNPFPQPAIPAADVIFPKTAQYIVLPSHFHPPYVLQWTASIQHQIGRAWMAQLDYVGNETSHQTWGFPLNPAVYTSGSPSANYSKRFRLYLENPSQGAAFTGGGGGSVLIADSATASYNGLIATIQHRMSNFTFLANYTWSHCIDVEDAQGDIGGTTVEDPYNPRLDRANCGFDYRGMFNANGVVTSKFTSLHGIAAMLANNWEVGPLLRITDGAPLTVTDGTDISGTDVNNDRPNLTGSTTYTHNNVVTNPTYLNHDAFAYQTNGTYGNLGRNSFRGPKYVGLDAELSRFFPVTERTKLVFRIEAFNVMNHPNFNSPSSGNLKVNNSKTFGQITSANDPRIWQGAVKFVF